MATTEKNKLYKFVACMFDREDSLKFNEIIEAPNEETAVMKFKKKWDIKLFTYKEIFYDEKRATGEK